MAEATATLSDAPTFGNPRLDTAHRMIALYNEQDADGFVIFVVRHHQALR